MSEQNTEQGFEGFCQGCGHTHILYKVFPDVERYRCRNCKNTELNGEPTQWQMKAQSCDIIQAASQK